MLVIKLNTNCLCNFNKKKLKKLVYDVQNIVKRTISQFKLIQSINNDGRVNLSITKILASKLKLHLVIVAASVKVSNSFSFPNMINGLKSIGRFDKM